MRTLQGLGVCSGFAAGAWLGGAEAPVKIINAGISPITVSLIMVVGVFWLVGASQLIICGTSYVRNDVHQAPHLIIWAVLAGCMWAVANTMTIYAIRDVGLSIASPCGIRTACLASFGASACSTTAPRRMEPLVQPAMDPAGD
jgi:hypothetical protein